MRVQLLAVPLLALALTACGAQAGGDAASPQASSSADARQAAGVKFAQCMREHGVQMEDPKPGEGIRIMNKAGEEQTVKKAQEACKEFLKGAVGEKGKGPDPAQRDRMLKFAQCMRQHGIDMPDPGDDGMVKLDIKPGTPESKVKAAQQACKEYAPGGLM